MGNCICNCAHVKHGELYEIIEDKDSNDNIITISKEYKGIKSYCDKCNNIFQDFYEKYGDKNVSWTIENVIMDCYCPSETQNLLDSMKSDLKNLLDNYKLND